MLQHLAAVCAHIEEPANAAEENLAFVAGIVAGGVDPEDPHGPPAIDLPEDPIEAYGVFSAAVATALAAESQLSDTAAGPYQQQLQALTAEYLAGLTPEDLEAAAAAAGFENPELVGFTGHAPHPLAVWLDPSVPADAEVKKKIQALAQARHDALCAGQEINGKALGQWDLAATSSALPEGFDSWLAAEADLAEVQYDFDTAATVVAHFGADAKPEQIAQLLRLENRIATAQNFEPGVDYGTATAAARHHVDELLGAVTAAQLSAAVEAAKHQGQVTDAQLQTLDAHHVLQLVRASTPAAERQDIADTVAERTALLTNSATCATNVSAALEAGPIDAANAGALVQQLRAIAEVHTAAATWDTFSAAPLNQAVMQAGQTKVLAWADELKVGALRKFISDTGIATAAQASTATKSQLGKLLHGHLNSSSAVVTAVKNELPPPKAAAKPAQAPSPKPAEATQSTKPSSRFGIQHAQLVAALQQAQAAHAAVPKPMDAAAVAAWDFGPGTPANLGGTHPKTLHTGPDGTTWIAKREGKPHAGAITHTEAAASRLVARAGLPVVPVYATKVDGHPVSVQPLLAGAKPISGSASSWSQADVDEIVRLHVTSWALSNHDPHRDNVLRTSTGGLVPIDQGQSFKNFGTDKLKLGYRPSTTTVYHQVYDAHLAGQLGTGVQVNPAAAHSVIRRLEAVPDAEWRATLHTVAHAGASQNLTWVAPMRARAAKTHGIAESAVTTNQIAETFLDYAVERKQNLRRDFVEFFTGDLKIASAAALAHLGKG
ncbi:hypothetical protein [Amycolatopsis mediterranei]|uniref:Uncharacterized protein n=1 Tax=Amycolatopsis mediterranei (strain U-32) TaxID=749927 RepID=A0A0H3DH88_AMYMU|nr:hypothetical protein [Amycolatopsis mediterranei]ADJ49004.1 conserved hypothetical protein [Amycolatopsis mediterranei U32]UZF74038.1 HipA domain-containing protein [Amycolatopsis mediterranei]